MIRILALGDILSPGTVKFMTEKLWDIRRQTKADFVIANGENASFLSGIGPQDAAALLDAGIDCITGGNHTMATKQIFSMLDSSDRILRPLNLPDENPGSGYTILPIRDRKILVLSAMGCLFMDAGTPDPVPAIEKILSREKGRYDFSILDLHAEATGEKLTAAFRLDGKVTAVFGTHTHVATADETVLPNGTGYISDIGFCGHSEGVLGVDPSVMCERQRTRLRTSYAEAKGPFVLQGILIEIDEATQRTASLRRVTFS